MNRPASSPHLHHWLDAIQRGEATSGPQPQLAHGVPTPNEEERQHLRQWHAELTGQQLDDRWLAQVLAPAPQADLAVVSSAPVSHEKQGLGSRWLRGWARSEDRPVHRYTDEAAWRKIVNVLRRWRKIAALGCVGTLTGGGAFFAFHIIPAFNEIERQHQLGLKAVGGSEDALMQLPLGSELMAQWMHLMHQIQGTGLVMAMGLGLMTLAMALDTHVQRLSATQSSPADRLRWSLSPRAQRYLANRAPHAPFLRADRRRLNELAAKDQTDHLALAPEAVLSIKAA